MIKQLLLPLLIFSSLFAKDIEEMDKIVPLTPEVEKSLYIESALFVAVFTLMSIVSIVISKKHAKQNALKAKEEREKQKAQKEAEHTAQPSVTKDTHEIQRVTELSKMLKNGLITDEEFQILSNSSKEKSH